MSVSALLSYLPYLLAAAAACLLASFLNSYILQPWLLLRHYVAAGLRGPSWRPLLGDLPELLAMRQRTDEYFHRAFAESAAAYGRVSYSFLGPELRLRALDAALVKAILSDASGVWRKPEVMRATIGRLLGNGLVTSEGAMHRAHRAMISPAFHFAALAVLPPLMARAADVALDRWLALPGARGGGAGGGGAGSSTGEPRGALVDMHQEMSAVALQIIGEAAFGGEIADASGAGSIYAAVDELLQIVVRNVLSGIAFIPFVDWLPIADIKQSNKKCAEVKAVLLSAIARRRARRAAAAAATAADAPASTGDAPATAASGQLIDFILDARGDAGAGDGAAAAAAAASGAPPPPPPRARFTDGEVLDHAITMALAGHETTAQAMCWSMYLLATEAPHWRDEARAQVLAVCGPARAPAHADLERLPALGCIVSEAMRLYPPVPFIVRTAAADVQLPWSGGGGGGSLAVRAGTSVVVPIAGLHRDEEHWEAPHAFRPSRWARGAAAATRSGSAFAFLPFSAGSRNCIGAQFALLEVKVLLARLLQRCDWALDASYVHRPQMTITLRPAAGMPMRVWPLQQAA